jgi:hypothetical protein
MVTKEAKLNDDITADADVNRQTSNDLSHSVSDRGRITGKEVELRRAKRARSLVRGNRH